MFFSNIMQTIIILLLGAIIGGCLYHYNLKNTIMSLNLDFFKTDQTLLNNIASYWLKLIKFIMEKINI
ncbi:hypothetical protein [Candidatus Phytoplasma mali]|uniref:hypothetical protein n=1 Tax=Apple proliferation phytoplasma TaxID=37692 RepID=UPI00059D3D35|nr:hypothetical protein [Candidatus Phytoplasma mali]